MFTKKTYSALANDPGLLANKLHTRYVYELSAEKQVKIKELIESTIDNYSDDKLMQLAFNSETKRLIAELIACKREPNWQKVIHKFLKGMLNILEREISRARRIRKPARISKHILKAMKRLHIYKEGDIVRVEEPSLDIVKVNYISIFHSPEYDGKYKSWRDTEFKFSMYFDKGIFVWDYINVHRDLRGKGTGTKLVFFCEKMAKDLGFRRFSVEWPNRSYWVNKAGYDIPMNYRIGSSSKKMEYTHEGYKEI